MRKNSFYIGTGVLGMWLFAACSQDGVPDNGASGSAEMCIYTDVARADGEETDAGSTANDAVFLFWDFGDVLERMGVALIMKSWVCLRRTRKLRIYVRLMC